MTLRWVNIRQSHVATAHVYLPGDERRLRLRIIRLFSRRQGSDRRGQGYFLLVEDPARPESRIDNINPDAAICVEVESFTAAKAAAETLLAQGQVLLAPGVSCQPRSGSVA